VYHGLAPCTTALPSFLTHLLLLGPSSAAQQVLGAHLPLPQHMSLVGTQTCAQLYSTTGATNAGPHSGPRDTTAPGFSFQQIHTYTPAHTHTQDFTFFFPSCLKGQPVELLEIGHFKANIYII